jgi:tRNA(fMet)-specific endonuclease VapC
MESRALIDTDILSLLMRNDRAVVNRTERYLIPLSILTISAITRYEILRGLRVKRATSQLIEFEDFCRDNEVLPLTDSILIRSSEIYADLSARGQLLLDADIFIAATAIEHGLVLVTNNVLHFNRIPDINIENWSR